MKQNYNENDTCQLIICSFVYKYRIRKSKFTLPLIKKRWKMWKVKTID